MKKLHYFLLTISLIFLLLIVSLLLFLICKNIYSPGFAEIKLSDLLLIFTNLLVGIGIAISIAIFNERNINNRKTKDTYYDMLNKVKNSLETIPVPGKRNIKAFLQKELQVKKQFSCCIYTIVSTSRDKKFNNLIEKVKAIGNEYFNYVEDNLYQNAPLKHNEISIESKERDVFMLKISETLCLLYQQIQ